LIHWLSLVEEDRSKRRALRDVRHGPWSSGAGLSAYAPGEVRHAGKRLTMLPQPAAAALTRLRPEAGRAPAHVLSCAGAGRQ
jgi:hypothetical protein